LGFPNPSTLPETGSDLHRAWRTRLCCVFRLSQPPDAFFRPQPLRPCFMPVTPLGFRLQRLSPPGSWQPLDRTALHAVSSSLSGSPSAEASDVPSLDDRSSKGSSTREIRSSPCRCYPNTTTPILSWHFSPPRLLTSDLDAVLPRRLLSWAFPSTRAATAPIALALQSLKDPRP